MPITGRTGSRNYRQRSSSESDSSEEPEIMRPSVKPPSRPRSRSRSPSRRSHSSPRPSSVPRHSRGHSYKMSSHRFPPPPRRRSRSPSARRRSPLPPHKRAHSSHRSSLSPVPKRHHSRGPSESDRYHHRNYDGRSEHDSNKRRYHSRRPSPSRSGEHHSSREMPSSSHHDRWPPERKYSRERESGRPKDGHHPSRDDRYRDGKYSHNHDRRDITPPSSRKLDAQPSPKTPSQGSRLPPTSEQDTRKKRSLYPSEHNCEYQSPMRGVEQRSDSATYRHDRITDNYQRSSPPPLRDNKTLPDMSDNTTAPYGRKSPERKSGSDLEYPPDRFGQTLDERFKAVAVENNRCLEPRIQYTREDLEKITIDVRRNLREPSPTIRRILNPEEIKVSRRPGEGVRPIFDREEIKMAPVDLREDAFFERRVVAVVRNTEKDGSLGGSVSLPLGAGGGSLPFRDLYQDQDPLDGRQQQFDSYRSNTGVLLSERWQGKIEAPLSHKLMPRADSLERYDKPLGPPDGYRSDDDLVPHNRSYPGPLPSHDLSGDEKGYPPRDTLDLRRKEDLGYPDEFSDTDLRHDAGSRRTSSESRPRPVPDHHDYNPKESNRPASRDSRGSSWHRDFGRKHRESSLGRYSLERNLSSRLSHSSNGSYMDDLDFRRDRKHDLREDPPKRDRLSGYPSRSGHYKYDVWLNKSDSGRKSPGYFEVHDEQENVVVPKRQNEQEHVFPEEQNSDINQSQEQQGAASCPKQHNICGKRRGLNHRQRYRRKKKMLKMLEAAKQVAGGGVEGACLYFISGPLTHSVNK